MSFTGQATSSTSSIMDALTDYAKETGLDLANNPFAAILRESNSPQAILQLLLERENAFKEYRDGKRGLMNRLSPIVKVLQALSGILREAARLVPFPLASVLFAGIDALLAAASGVTSSYDALLDLFECLGNFLKRLEIYTTIPSTPVMTDIIIKIMVQLLSVLALAMKQVKEGRFKKFAKKLLGDSEIEAVLQRLDRLTQDEARMTTAQTLGVVHGLVGNIKVVMEDGKASTDIIRQDLVAVHQILNDMNKMKRDQLQKNVQHWLLPPDPSINHDFIWKAHHAGTSEWLFRSNVITKWKASESPLWIHGKPGSGKSTLLSAIIEEIEDMRTAGLAMIAYYYFDFRDAKKQDRYGLLSSLISQLSAESYSCFRVLSQLYSDYAGRTLKPTTSRLTKCLKDMLRLPGQGPIYIIVDALDESPNFPGRPSAREEVLELVEELVGLKLQNVHLCVASRPEMDIRIVLEPLISLKISLHEESGQKEDIIEYIKFVVHSDWNLRRWKEEDKQLVVDTLSEKACGMFRWVVCQADSLRRTLPASIRRVLDDLPKTLDETYDRTLRGIDEEKREYAQRLFQCLIVSVRPLRVEELAEVLAIQFDGAALPTFNTDWRPENAEEAVISVCSSLVAIADNEGHHVVQFSHFSVKEYLTSERLATAEERLSYYHILTEPAHTILAHASVSVLLHLDDKIDRSTICHFPLASYAAQHWVDHAQHKNVSSYVQEVMKHLFNPSKPHFVAWVWLYDIDRLTEPMSTVRPTQPKAMPLYYASLCGFHGLMEHLIAAHSPDVNSRGGSHTTPLHAATVKGHVEIASLLLKNGADPNSRDDRGRAPLHRVSQGGHIVMVESSLEIARLLVNRGVDVNAIDKEGWTPLHAAARSGYREIAELLLKFGAILDAPNSTQETPLHVACRSGELDVSRLLINRGSDFNFPNAAGFVPLHLVSRFGHVEAAELLLNCGTKVDVHEIRQWTPLHYASLYGHPNLAQLLIDRGADVNAHEVYGWTALHLASVLGHLDMAKLLVDHGGEVDSRNDKQDPPWDLASMLKRFEMSAQLIDGGAAVSLQDCRGLTPLHVASYCGHLHITKFFLARGVDVNIRARNEQTPLFLACMRGKPSIIRFLIEQGADVHVRDSSNWNPVHIASLNGHLDAVELLINAGIPLDIRNGTQKTPLALASKEGKVEVGRFLIERGADTNARDKWDRTPLHFATQYGHFDMVQLLLDHGVDVNIQKSNLWRPLHLASAHGHLGIAQLLVQRGASVDASNSKQETSLQLAAGNGRVEISRLLLDNGAALHSTNSNGWTPLHTASRRGKIDVVKVLLQRGADVDVVNKANKTAAELALENGKAEIAKFIADYKADPNIRNKICSITLDTAQYGADGGGKDEAKALLHAAAEDGKIDVVKSLLEQGVDINSRDASNQTPLHAAAQKGNLNVVCLLIERGAEVDLRDNWDTTPLHEASQFGLLEISRVLVDHGANMNARQLNRWTLNHWTPIHISASFGHLEVVKLLLERGADAGALSGEGETPLQLSLQRGRREIADLLRKHGTR